MSAVISTREELSRMSKEQLIAELVDLRRRIRSLEAEQVHYEQAEKLLKEREAELRRAQTMARIGVFVWDDGTDRCAFCSEELADLLGLSVPQVMKSWRSQERVLETLHPDDRARYDQVVKEATKNAAPYSVEFRMLDDEGNVQHRRELGEPVLDDDGRLLRTFGTVQDITDIKRAEEALRESQSRFQDFAAASADWFWEMDAELRFTYMSVNVERALSRAPEWYYGKTREDILGEGYDRDAWKAHIQTLRDRKPFRDFTYPLASDGAEQRWLSTSGIPIFDEDGTFLGYRGCGRNSTAAVAAEQALRESELRYRNLVQLSPDGIIINFEDRIAFANPAAVRFLGAEAAGDLIGRRMLDFIHPDFHKLVRARVGSVLEKEENQAWIEQVYVGVDGRVFYVESSATPISYRGKTAVLTVFGDITDRKKAEEALRESDARFREIFDESPVSLWVEDWSALKRVLNQLAEQGVEDLSDYFREHLEQLLEAYDLPEVVDISRETLRVYRASSKQELFEIMGSDRVDPEDLEGFREQLSRLFAGARSNEYEARETACDGSRIVTRMRTVIPPNYGDSWARVLITIEDITEQRRDRDALSLSESRYRELFDESPVPMLEEDWRPVKQLLDGLAKQGVEDLRGYFRDHPDQLGRAYDAARRYGISQGAVDLYRASSKDELRAAMTQQTADPDELRGYGDMIADFYGGATSYEYEADEIACDGSHIATRIRAVIPPKYLDTWSRVFVTIEDITERKNVETQLHQAQKLRAIGQLTGGVAHDFNNLLAVIMGNAEVLSLRLGEDDKQTQALIKAASRGADLTQRLLAFSRKQPLSPQAIYMDTLVSSTLDMLHRTLGETIETRTSMGPDLWRAMADPGQLEGALLNLAINARDAMPGGGTMTIETANVELNEDNIAAGTEMSPGEYVMLAVSDTGSGMPPEVLEYAFEPFFTTKDVGEGSGLGLSMVYGFARQSGGQVTIHSEDGRGTTVKLYLPRAEGSDQPVRKTVSALDPKARGEKVLVLEDDADVRQLAVSILRGLGYEVLQAQDGKAALAVLKGSPPVDLLLSDVVLSGGMTGPQVSDVARRIYRATKTLFMSGYAETALRDHRAVLDGAGLINKPFHRRELAQKVRAALDNGD